MAPSDEHVAEADDLTFVNKSVSVPVQFGKMPVMKIYLVTEQDLGAYENAVGEVSTALGFGTFALGTAIATLTTVLTSALSPWAFATYVLLTVLFGVVFAWSAVKFLSALSGKKRARSRMMHDSTAVAPRAALPPPPPKNEATKKTAPTEET